MREAFDVYSDGLFSLPLNIPGTPYGKAVRAREFIVGEIESELLPLLLLHGPSHSLLWSRFQHFIRRSAW